MLFGQTIDISSVVHKLDIIFFGEKIMLSNDFKLN